MQPPFTEAAAQLLAPTEFEMLFIRLPLAAVLGTALAFRPRRRSQGARKVVVIQTQIMLAVVGAVIMLVVGNSLSRAFGIVGAAGLIRYRSNIADPKDAVVMLSSGIRKRRVSACINSEWAPLFSMILLWFVDSSNRGPKYFELKSAMPADEFGPRQGVLSARSQYGNCSGRRRWIVTRVGAGRLRTKDVSDTLRLVGAGPMWWSGNRRNEPVAIL